MDEEAKVEEETSRGDEQKVNNAEDVDNGVLVANAEVGGDDDETNKGEEEQEVNNTEDVDDGAVVAATAEAGGDDDHHQGDDNNNNIDGDVWDFDDIEVLETAREVLLTETNSDVRGGWGEWKFEGDEVWREWEMYPRNAANEAVHHEIDDEWVVEDLWAFDDVPNNGFNGHAPNPRGPQA